MALLADLFSGEGGVTGGAVPDKEVPDVGGIPHVPLHCQADTPLPAEVVIVEGAAGHVMWSLEAVHL